MENPNQEPLQDDANILKEKPKRKQTLTDEQRAKKAEHMRKISLARIEKARLANEAKLEEKEDKIVEKLAKVEVKKEQVRKIKEEKKIPEPKAELKTQKAKRFKKVVVEEDSTDSEDYYDDDGGSSSQDEVIYVAKKPTKKAQDKSIIKPKKEAKMKEIETPKTVIKFL
jgi:colicin import membrane protein